MSSFWSAACRKTPSEIIESFPKLSSLRALVEAESLPIRMLRSVTRDERKPARLMLVGEQPGDKERPRRQAICRTGRACSSGHGGRWDFAQRGFVANAVKHFKHEMCGKRRLHKRLNVYEIER